MTKIVRNVLNAIEMYKLQDLILKEYTKSGLSDGEFAAMATEKVTPRAAFTRNHISYARDALEIPSNSLKGVQNPQSLMRIVDLEKRIAALEDRLEVYIKGCAGRVA